MLCVDGRTDVNNLGRVSSAFVNWDICNWSQTTLNVDYLNDLSEKDLSVSKITIGCK